MKPRTSPPALPRLKMPSGRFAAAPLTRLPPLLLFLALPVTALAQFNFITTNNTITITQYTGPGGDVAIPDTIDALPVTSIGGYAFSSCASLTSVTIGNSVTSIGYGAFSVCTRLSVITVDTNNSAYSSLSGVLFNKTQTTLVKCPEGKAGSYTVPESVTNIGDQAFYYCSSLTNVIIGSGVTTIGTKAFSICSSLASITIPNGVTRIGDQAFYGCSYLTSISIPNSVTNIGDQAFYYCFSLTSVMVGNGVTTIGYYAFWGCSGLTSITMPNSVTRIGEYAFAWCSSLANATIGNSVTSIGYGAFSDCTRLSVITVETNNSAYSSLSGVLFNKSQTTLVKCPEGKAGSYTVPESVTNIGE